MFVRFFNGLCVATRVIVMTIAYVLINAEQSHEEEVLKDISSMDGIIEAHLVYGVYDLVAKIQASSMKELKQILDKIRSHKWVRATMTTVCAD